MRGTAFPLPAESMSVTEHARDSLRRTVCIACWNEFFLYEKMGRRAIVLAGSNSEAGSNKSVQTCPHNPQKMGIQGDASPWREFEGRALEVFPSAAGTFSGAGGNILLVRVGGGWNNFTRETSPQILTLLVRKYTIRGNEISRRVTNHAGGAPSSTKRKSRDGIVGIESG